jgi:hypothetical protein
VTKKNDALITISNIINARRRILYDMREIISGNSRIRHLTDRPHFLLHRLLAGVFLRPTVAAIIAEGLVDSGMEQC